MNQSQDHRQPLRKLNRASEIVVSDPADDLPMSNVLDVTLTPLIQSQQNLEDVWRGYSPEEIENCCNTDVLGLRYRMSLGSQ